MTILNKDHLVSLGESETTALPWSQVMLLDEFTSPVADFWLITIFNAASIYNASFNDIIPSDILDSIQTGLVRLLLSNTSEAFIDIIDPIYTELVIKLRIPESNIILLSGSPDINTTITQVALAHNKKEIKAGWFVLFLIGAVRQIKRDHDGEMITDRTRTVFNKKFINLGGRWRLHRPALVALLTATNLLEYGYVSLFECDDHMTWEKIWNTLINHHRNNVIAMTLLEENKEKIINLPPLYIDTTGFNHENYVNESVLLDCLCHESLHEYYNNTYFSVVTETNYYTTGQFVPTRAITEKTFKPIAFRHAFIIMGPPGMLLLLHQLGFKTFSPYINESYDDEKDDIIRMLLVINEIDRLCKLEGDELTEFLTLTSEICDFNYNILMDPETPGLIMLN